VSETRPPSGRGAPTQTRRRDGSVVELVDMARLICRRYRAEFPDEQGRYGEAGEAWCRHDNQWILHWAVEDVDGDERLDGQLRWLAGVLDARDFPIERLVRNLEIAGEVARLADQPELGGRLTRAADPLRTWPD
jgi:hypothetical protein